MINIGSYTAQVVIQDGAQSSYNIAYLGPAAEADIFSFPGTFAWHELWQSCDWNCQGIARLSYLDKVFGLVKYGLYPYPWDERPRYLEIEHLEASPTSISRIAGADISGDRIVEPVGQWLVWYAVSVGIQFCTENEETPLILLESKGSAFDYYKNKIGMTYIGPGTAAPGEDSYGFIFQRAEAERFCEQHTDKFGSPSPISLSR
jgi:hypothetical protein